ncbi:MAG TPA: molybdopterin converting factor subunit 1 [Polyangiaceae bacterium]|jgi:molybdopterin synthase sulfur carrier subunit
MRVRVLYFAGVRDVVARDEETCDLPDGIATVGDFARWIGDARGLADRMASIRIARNERFADADEPLAGGDVLALIPPVSGG